MTIFDFHLHWYPQYRAELFKHRLRDLGKNGSSLVGVVYDTELVDCWAAFGEAWKELPLSQRRETETSLSGVWEEAGLTLFFYRGTQAISEENVELLILGSAPDTGPLSAMVSDSLEAERVVLLPWGFGKWKGRRGELVRKEMELPRNGLFLSDSGSRPERGLGSAWISGVYHDLAASPRLDGSDPLPMPDEESRAFSLVMEGEIHETLPEGVGAFGKWLKENAASLRSSELPRSTGGSIRQQWNLRRRGFSFPLSLPEGFTGQSDRGDIESATDRYARRFSGEVGAFFLERQASLTLSLAEGAIQRDSNEVPRSVLDIGGGHAQLAPHFLDRGWVVTVFASHESCRKRTDRIMGEGHYKFQTGDLLKLPFPDDSFDVVTAFRLVTHETDWERLLAEAVRVSREVVIVDYPDIRSFNALSRMLFLVKRAIEKDTREFALFNRKQIAAGFEKAGAGQLQWRPQFFLPMALYRMVGSGRLAAGLEKVFSRLGLTGLFGSPVIVGSRKNRNK